MGHSGHSTGWSILLLLAASTGISQTADFTAGWQEQGRAASFGIAVGDVDGDGDADAYVADFDGMDTLWLNDGSGNLTDSGQSLDTGRGSFPILGLIDGDLYLDVWLARHLQTNRVWLNDTSGLFTDSGQALGTSSSRRGAALGDLDGDGDLDVFVPTDDSSKPNAVLFNDGSGTFTDSGQSVGLYWSRAVALGDVDGDNDLDVLIGNNGANKLWLNNGSGIFTDSGQTIGSGGTFDVALGDLDGDNDLDAFFANGSLSGDQNRVWFNNGSGTFSDSGQSLGNGYAFSVVLADVDDDNDLDAVVGNNSGEVNVLWLNNGSGTFSDSGQSLGVGAAIGVAAADVDGDNDVDVFVANRYHPDEVFLNDGSGVFSHSGLLLGSFEATAVDLGDLDGDGDLDAFVGSVAGTSRVLLNTGNGTFVDSNQWLVNGTGNNNDHVILADFDGDLDLDALVANSPQTGAADMASRLWLNDGSAGFSPSGQLIGADNTGALAVGDVDGDLDLDLVVGNAPYFSAVGENRLWLNDGAGVFSLSPPALGEGNTRAVALADLDGDLDLDLFVGNSGGANQIWLNNGSGVFTDTAQLLGIGDTFAVGVGDLDGDSDLDVFVGNHGANTVWLNDGAGAMTDTAQSLGGFMTQTVHLLDADGDGDLDAWTSNGSGSSQANKLWLNDGTGTFSDSGLLLGLSASGGSAMGDLDGDSDEDIFVANQFGDSRVWLNQRLSAGIFSDGWETGDLNQWSSSVP